MSFNSFSNSPFGKGLYGAVALFMLWELWTWIFDIPPDVFPSFFSVVGAMYDRGPLLVQELGFTFIRTIAAWFLSLVLAGVLACAMDLSRRFEQVALYPLLAFQHVPKVAITPLLVILMGHGWLPVVALGVLIAFFPMFEGYRNGLKDDRIGIRSVFGPLSRNKIQRLLVIKLPEAMLKILDGAQLGMTFAIVGVLVGELAIKDHGLGRLIDEATGNFQYDFEMAAVLAACLLGLGLYGLVVLAKNIPTLARYRYSVSSIVTERPDESE